MIVRAFRSSCSLSGESQAARLGFDRHYGRGPPRTTTCEPTVFFPRGKSNVLAQKLYATKDECQVFSFQVKGKIAFFLVPEVKPTHVYEVKVRTCCFFLQATVCLLFLFAPAIAGDNASTAAKPTAEEWSRLRQSLRERYPDEYAVRLNAARVAADLEEFVLRCAGHPELAGVTSEARELMAELHRLTGKWARSKALYEEIAVAAPADEQRSRALFVLGLEQYLRGLHYARISRRSGRELRGAYDYWQQLTTAYPQSEWSQRAARDFRYLELARGDQQAPEFNLTFDLDRKSKRYSVAELRGNVVLLCFWRAANEQQKTNAQDLADSRVRTMEEYPHLRGRIVVLAVNLDRSAETFETGVADWAVRWPQFHAAEGFDSDIASAYAIPRTPHWAVIDVKGKLSYLGGRYAEFTQHATVALQGVRQDEATGAK